MKKGLKIIIGILLVIGIGIGGFTLMQKIEHDQMAEIVKSEEVREIIEDDLKYIEPTALTIDGIIQTYEISNFEKNPMGGIVIYLYVNNNKNYTVSIFLHRNSQTGELESGGGSWSRDLDRLIKGQ